MAHYQEYRCSQCDKLLFKGMLIEGEIEVKCKACHGFTRVQVSESSEYLCGIRPCPNRVAMFLAGDNKPVLPPEAL